MSFLINPYAFGSAANAVSFDSNTWLTRDAGLTGAADSSQGILSFWFRINLVNGYSADPTFLAGGSINDPSVLVSRQSDHKISVQVRDSVSSNPSGKSLQFTTSTAYIATAGYYHFLASWDTNFTAGNKLAHLYISDASDKAVAADLFGAFNVDYTCDNYGIMSNTGFSGTSGAADIADFFFAPGSFLDFSNSTNRRKFISATGRPVNLGVDGSATGITPLVFMSGALDAWQTNKGTGGGMTMHNYLTASTDNP